MLAADRQRLRCIENSCRQIALLVRECEGDYARFAESADAAKTACAHLNCISDMACGLSPQVCKLFKSNGFRENYLYSLRFWVGDTQGGDERKRRVVWEIIANDCKDLLLVVSGLLQNKT